MYNMIQAGTLKRGGASSSVLGTIAESNETGTFDPLLEIRRGEETNVEYHKKVILTKVVIACITVCILNSLFVTNACGTDLYQLYIDGMRLKRPRKDYSYKRIGKQILSMKKDLILSLIYQT